jgi:hypothetical protein
MNKVDRSIQEFIVSRNWFEALYSKLDFRYKTMKIALNLFLQRGGKTIVETGTLHEDNNWGAGMSTLIFGHVAHMFGAHVYSVDIKQAFIDGARKITDKYNDSITYTCQDSLVYLSNFPGKIDLLYLDSYDYPMFPHEGDPKLAQEHQFKEYLAAKNKLTKDSIVLLDDNEIRLGDKESTLVVGAKTGLLKWAMLEDGWVMIDDAQQTLFQRK